jgi:negative regulator of sigma E activity
MKSVNVRELLSAAVDGELSPAERKVAQRLLRESKSARALFAELKSDAARIQKLPRVVAPADLAENVLAVINDRTMGPTPLPPGPRRERKFNWSWLPIGANVAAAAGVLLAITLGSYLYFSASQHNSDSKDLGVANLPPVRQPDGAAGQGRGNARPEPRDRAVELGPMPEAIVQRSPELGPSPREVDDRKTFSPPLEMPEIEPFQPDKIRLSTVVAMGDLASDTELLKRLATEMKKDELVRLDLFCQSTAKGLEQVVANLKISGITVVTDGYAQSRLEKKQPVELMIFTESLTPDAVARLLAGLATDDKKVGAGFFDTLVAAPFLADDLVKLGKLFGLPNVSPKLPKAKSGIDIRKPLPEGTADHVATSLSGMGTTTVSPRPKSERMAVVVAYSPVNGNPAASREIRQFIERRGERKPDAKPLMLVLKMIPK